MKEYHSFPLETLIPGRAATYCTDSMPPSPFSFDDCWHCRGTGYQDVSCPWSGVDQVECGHCAGSGFGELGLIMTGLLTPPEDGCGTTVLKTRGV